MLLLVLQWCLRRRQLLLVLHLAVSRCLLLLVGLELSLRRGSLLLLKLGWSLSLHGRLLLVWVLQL